MLIFAVLYHDYYRWQIEPNGMLDSILLWNLKAKLIGEAFLNSKPIPFHDAYWKFDSYPIGLPLNLAYLSVLNGSWSLNVVYGYNIFLFILCVALFIKFLLDSNYSLKETILSWLLFLVFMLEFNVLMNHSSIIADFPIFVGVFCLAYLYFSKWTSWTTLLFALNLGWLFFTKNEGIFYLPIGVILYFLKLKQEAHIFQQGKTIFSFFLFLALSLFPNLVHKMEPEIIPIDFQRKESIEWTISIILDKAKWIFSYASQFHFQFLLGIHLLILVLYLTYSEKNLEKYLLFLVLSGLPLLYILPYFFSNYDHSEASKFLGETYRNLNAYEKEIYHLQEHLESSFHRINTHYLPLFLFIGFRLLKKNYKHML